MTPPIDVSPVSDILEAFGHSAATRDDLIESPADSETLTYQLLAARRAQLEDAETLRRVRAL